MKYEQHVKDIYKIAGMLEMLTCMQECTLNSGIVSELVDAVDKLELIGADLLAVDKTELICADLLMEAMVPEIMIAEKDQYKIDFFADDDPETDVNAHEGSEESPPESQPADQ